MQLQTTNDCIRHKKRRESVGMKYEERKMNNTHTHTQKIEKRGPVSEETGKRRK